MTLLAAFVLTLFSSGRWAVPLAAWSSPVLLLGFVRSGRAVHRLLLAALVIYAAWCISWRGMVPVPAAAYFPIMLLIALPTLLPYILDRLLVARRAGFASTLVFPCAWVTTEYLISIASPYGSWGLVAYTQVDHLPLVQSAAVTGLWGIGFLMAWLASVVNWARERKFRWPEVRAGLVTYGGVLGAVLLLGGARLALAPPNSDTFRFAALTVAWPGWLSPHDLLTRSRTGSALETLRAGLHEHEALLAAGVRAEARAGARLIAWSELNAFVLEDEEIAFQGRLSALARETGAYLVVGAAVFTPGRGYYENQLLAFDPAGTMLARYHKARPVPGDPERGADRAIPVFQTDLGRVAGAVCFDGDFPDLISRAGRERADLLVVPASDWRAIDPIHTRMALMRGVENGCSVARQTHWGLSAVADFQGRILAASDDFRATPSTTVAQIPSRGVWTFYPRCPLLLPWLCMAGIAVFGATTLRRSSGRAGASSAPGDGGAPSRSP